MNASQANASVFFGATRDLAFKKIFPPLQEMAKRGRLDVPAIGVGHVHLYVSAYVETLIERGARVVLADPDGLWYSGLATGCAADRAPDRSRRLRSCPRRRGDFAKRTQFRSPPRVRPCA